MRYNKRLIKSILTVIAFIFVLMYSLSFISAEINQTQIDKGYIWLAEKTENCSTSLQENIFTLLSAKTCKDNLLSQSSNNTCWPGSSCNVKETAQAGFALKEAGSTPTQVETWMLSKKKAPTNLDWFLQIETEESSLCEITYDSRTYDVQINEDKKVESNAGTCLSISENGYWLKVSNRCYEKEFEISCDKGFVTSMIFKDQESDTINLLQKSASGSSGGTTTEVVNSSCFSDSASCNYEASLWGALFLQSLGKDTRPYLPYLITAAEDNKRYLPEAFLFILTGDEDYKNQLLLRQKNSKYWEASGDRIYDTALGTLALKSQLERESSIDWLMENQDDQGSWGGSIKNTAFVLYVLQPKSAPSSGPATKPSCETAGYFCMSGFTCSGNGGTILTEYACAVSYQACCDKEITPSSCQDQGGELCSYGETCLGGVDDGGCCIGGTCSVEPQENACEASEGTCRFSCSDSEEESSFSCDSSSEVCCAKKTTTETSYWWVWVLIILIAIIIILIIFKDKTREYFYRIKHTFSKKKSGDDAPGSSGPMSLGQVHPVSRPMHRRLVPPPGSSKPRQGPRPTTKQSGELDEVLKKLKDMSK